MLFQAGIVFSISSSYMTDEGGNDLAEAMGMDSNNVSDLLCCVLSPL